MNTAQTNTATGLAGLIGLCVLFLFLFHFIGFRGIVTVGRSVG